MVVGGSVQGSEPGSRRWRLDRRVVFVFLDGVGLGEPDPIRNALATAAIPVIRGLLDGRAPVSTVVPYRGPRASLVGLDAGFGLAGLPQSGTGQAALLTGHITPVEYGRHFGPWVPVPLRNRVRAENLLARALAAGRTVAFANAYPEELVAQAQAADRPAAAVGRDTRRRRRAAQFLNAGPPLAALGAGVLNRHTSHLVRGDAVASEITNEGWREHLHRREVPLIGAADAGRNLARIAASHDLTLFAHYATDYAGHTRRLAAAVAAIERVDAFLGGLLPELGDGGLLVVASDHGNLEDCASGHTRNPALALVVGQGHGDVSRGWVALTDVTPSILEVLGVPSDGRRP